jgi:hypothetical protein
MPHIQFTWCSDLISVRRETCPHAQWTAATRTWTMSDTDTAKFMAASHVRLSYVRRTGEIAIDGERWVIGFVHGAPFRNRIFKRDNIAQDKDGIPEVAER